MTPLTSRSYVWPRVLVRVVRRVPHLIDPARGVVVRWCRVGTGRGP